ncbi:hypothetical protein ABVK25_005034 [Lepraria finkii]|uniref:Uncharacterized protein n=1 Tax=Lepraria finkii TaxID=1340010 RepID=A0ABR4BAF4_9LECA
MTLAGTCITPLRPTAPTIVTPRIAKGGAQPWDTYTYLSQLSPDWGIDGSIIDFPTHVHYFIWSWLLTPGQPETILNHQAICIASLLAPGTIGPGASFLSNQCLGIARATR